MSPYSVSKLKSGKVKVEGPSGVHAKATSMKKAKAQMRLLHAIEYNPDFKPRNERRNGKKYTAK